MKTAETVGSAKGIVKKLTENMQTSPKAVLETVLYVDDLSVASDFYASVLNLPLMNGDRRMKVHRTTGQNFLLLFEAGAEGQAIEVEGGTIPAHKGQTGMHMAFSVDHDDLEFWRRHLRDNDVPIESTVQWQSGDISLYFRDPAGNLIELATPDLWNDR